MAQSSPPLNCCSADFFLPMISTEELSSLLGAVYAAPLEPEMWQVFLDRVCALTHVSSGYLIGSYQTEGNVILAGGGLNFDPEIFELYNEHYGASDPYREPLMANPRIGLIAGEELVDHAALVQSELYNEVLLRYDLEHMNILSCAISNGDAEALSLWRSPKQGVLDAASCHLLQALLPHLQTALRLRTKVTAHAAVNLFSETALDAMSIAAFLVTGKGRVCHMNRRAAGYLEFSQELCLYRGRLTATNSVEAAQLEQLLCAATLQGPRHAESSPGGAMQLSGCHGTKGEGAKLQVTVIPAPTQNQIGEKELCAVVFVNDPSSMPGSRAALMRQLYRLTPAEGRLADLLLQGLDVKDAAQRLQLTLETARFHLKRVMAKTGTRRQSELIRLMLALPDSPSLHLG